MTAPYLTLGQAARETGIAKSTLSYDIKTGKLSVVEKSAAGYKIDPAELFRVYPPRPVQEQDSRTIPHLVQDTGEQASGIVHLHRSEAVIEQYEKRIAELSRALEREQEHSDFLKEQLKRSTLLLEHHKPVQPVPVEPQEPRKRGLLGMISGRKSS